MLTDRPLQIEVLVNSPGPHDQVRIREPFAGLQALGLDCRIHERPFRFSDCIRPHSLVIWQRPLPESRQRQWEHLQWLRERGCLLLTEWDDHPDLFPTESRDLLVAQDLAPIELCHGLHTSSSALADALRGKNPLTLVLENTLENVPPMNLVKHQQADLRVFIGNQNRQQDQQQLVEELNNWLNDEVHLRLVVIADQKLSSALRRDRVHSTKILNYQRYREVMSQCHIALLPLSRSIKNACKTPIKLMECAAESVATVSGPELYDKQAVRGLSIFAQNVKQIVPLARELSKDQALRTQIVARAHQWAKDEMSLGKQLSYRMWLYLNLWEKREYVDRKLRTRLKGTPWELDGELLK